MNYEVTKEWKNLNQIMGTDYDNTKQYRIHNNLEDLSAILCLTEVQNPSATLKGRKIPPLTEIYVAVGTNPHLKVKSESLDTGFDVEITAITE